MSIDPAATRAIEPGAPLAVPPFSVLERDGVFVAVDRRRANWIALNASGLAVLRSLSGSTIEEAAGRLAAERSLPLADAGRMLDRFCRELCRKGFLSGGPIDDEPATRGDSIRPAKLHEVWIVTNFECNLACRHCYARDRVSADRRRISAGDLVAMMDECRALGAETFYLTGGEPLLREDLAALVEGATRRSRAILFTNGTLVTGQVAAGLSPYRDRLVVQVSLEGPDDASNALLRGPGAAARAMSGIRRLLSAGIRVGVSSTPTAATAPFLPELTRQLATLEESGRGVDYHHIIYLLDSGDARRNGIRALDPAALGALIAACGDVVRKLRREGTRTRLAITNEKVFDAIASNGPRKDLCGAGCTILGINADGMLHPCATTMADRRHELGRLLGGDGRYAPGTIRRLWLEGEPARRVRSFTALAGPEPPGGDYRRFHGGGCWCHAPDPEGDVAAANPWFPMYEAMTERAILECATRNASPDDDAIGAPDPRILKSMARTRIPCAGARKSADLSRLGLDHGYCLCFA